MECRTRHLPLKWTLRMGGPDRLEWVVCKHMLRYLVTGPAACCLEQRYVPITAERREMMRNTVGCSRHESVNLEINRLQLCQPSIGYCD